MHADPDRLTTVSVRLSTLQNLRRYKVAGASLDDVLVELMENTPPQTFWSEVRRREAEAGPNVRAETLYRRAGLR